MTLLLVSIAAVGAIFLYLGGYAMGRKDERDYRGNEAVKAFNEAWERGTIEDLDG